jgi:apolipoprotein N-acyltransferase
MPASQTAAAAARLKALQGWRRRAAALLAGAASVLAMAPFFAWPVLWLTLPALVWLIDGAVERTHRWDGKARPLVQALAAADVGWWYGYGYFLAGLFWVGEAFLVEARIFAWLLPLAVALLPAGLALFYAAAAALAALVWRPGPARVLALALTFSALEWARGHVLTGFPWNVLGYALTFPLPLMQSAALFGIYGLTLFAVLIFAWPPVLWAESVPAHRGRNKRIVAVAIGTVPLAITAILGQMRLAQAPPHSVQGVKIRIVQPSVPQHEKWRPENQERIFFDHLWLSSQSASGEVDNLAGVTVVVWPEAAMPFRPLDHPAVLAALDRLLPAGTYLLSGAIRVEEPSAASERPRVFNSLLAFADNGSLVAGYDKIHLVPFGEFLPLQSALEAIGLEQLTRLRGGFATGVVPRPLLRLPGLPALGPLICYEAIFPHAIVQGTERPGVLVNVTNDGWFGNTTGPRQHLHQARVRAVEEGLPLVRAANNGISAMIDAHGRVLHRLDLNVRGVIDSRLPSALPPPPYARFGDGIFWGVWLAAALAHLFLTRGRSVQF